jgi:hypothetical protein
MTVKTNDAEWKAFYNDAAAWPDGTWHEDEEITVDGEPVYGDVDFGSVSDECAMTVKGGVVYLSIDQEGPTLETYFRRWKEKQTTATILVKLPKDKLGDFGAALAAFGAKIV